MSYSKAIVPSNGPARYEIVAGAFQENIYKPISSEEVGAHARDGYTILEPDGKGGYRRLEKPGAVRGGMLSRIFKKPPTYIAVQPSTAGNKATIHVPSIIIKGEGNLAVEDWASITLEGCVEGGEQRMASTIDPSNPTESFCRLVRRWVADHASSMRKEGKCPVTSFRQNKNPWIEVIRSQADEQAGLSVGVVQFGSDQWAKHFASLCAGTVQAFVKDVKFVDSRNLYHFTCSFTVDATKSSPTEMLLGVLLEHGSDEQARLMVENHISTRFEAFLSILEEHIIFPMDGKCVKLLATHFENVTRLRQEYGLICNTPSFKINPAQRQDMEKLLDNARNIQAEQQKHRLETAKEAAVSVEEQERLVLEALTSGQTQLRDFEAGRLFTSEQQRAERHQRLEEALLDFSHS